MYLKGIRDSRNLPQEGSEKRFIHRGDQWVNNYAYIFTIVYICPCLFYFLNLRFNRFKNSSSGHFKIFHKYRPHVDDVVLRTIQGGS